MPITRIAAVAAAIFWLTLPPVYGAQKGKGGPSTHGGGAHAKAPTQTSHGSPRPAAGPKTTTTSTHGNPHTTTTPKTHGNPHATTTPKTHGNPHATTTPTPKTHGKPHTTATSTSSDTPPPTSTTLNPPTTTTLNPIAQKLQGKPLGNRIQQMLPAGMSLNTASAGFKNQGQFIAAVHVSQNLGIPFAQLKATMLGTSTSPSPVDTTSSNPMSLGQAIQALRPTADATTEATRAQTQANVDLSPTSTTSTTSRTSTSKKKNGK